MRTTTYIGLASAGLLLAGCSAGSGAQGALALPDAGALRAKAHIAPNAGKSNLLYVPSYTDYAGGQVIVYDLPLKKEAQPVQIISIPEGKNSVDSYAALDDSGNLYLSSNSDSQVQIYPPGQSSPSQVITDGVSYPLGVAVDRAGTLYVANTFGYSYSYTGTIAEYPAGQTSPSIVVAQGLYNPEGIGLDPKGNLWVVNEYVPLGSGYFGSNVLKIKKGSQDAVDQHLTGLVSPIDVAVDKHENVYVSDDGLNVVNIYAKGHTSPEAQIVPPRDDLVQSYGLCFTANGKLFVSYITENSRTISALVEYSDPIHHPKLHRILTTANGLPGPSGNCAAELP